MSTNYAKPVSKKKPTTTQAEAIPGKEHLMTKAHDGAMVFSVDKWGCAERFLILGNEGGSYYATETTMTKANAKAVEACIAEDPGRMMKLILECTTGFPPRAYKKDPSLFVLALMASAKDPKVTQLAFHNLNRICMTPTNLFMFIKFIKEFRGWGRGLRDGVASWYNSKEIGKLERLVIKYQSREGWSHSDAIRQSHPHPPSPGHMALYKSLARPEGITVDFYKEAGLNLIATVEELKKETIAKAGKYDKKFIAHVCEVITANKLTHEMVMNEVKSIPDVWEALLQDMPYTAMIRNLAKMTAIDLLKPLSDATKLVVERLNNEELIKKARIHPFGVLLALSTYGSGHGVKGSLAWKPVPAINAAIDQAYYKAFKFVEPTGKNILIGLDVSGSMCSGGINGTHLTPREGSAAMCMTHLKTDPTTHVMAFSKGFVPCDIDASMSLKQVLAKVDGFPFESTNCALPMLYAMKNKLDVDAFVVYTDSETNHLGALQPSTALAQYRREHGKPESKLIVVGMVSNGFSIADPTDPHMMDVVGFDANAPSVIADFIRGKRTAVPVMGEPTEAEEPTTSDDTAPAEPEA